MSRKKNDYLRNFVKFVVFTALAYLLLYVFLKLS